MINFKLLAGALCMCLPGGTVCAYGDEVFSLEEIFRTADASGSMLRPAVSAIEEASLDISVAKAAMLPDINASLSISFLGDGFTTRRDYSDLQKAPIPHLGTGLSLALSQPVYMGGALREQVNMASLKTTAARYAEDQQRDDLRIRLARFYLDLYKCRNLIGIVDANISSARKVLDQMRARHKEGTALLNDITRYELLVSELELQRVKLNNTAVILNNNLVVSAGLPAGTVIRPDSAILSRSLAMQNEEWWLQEAMSNAPSLRLGVTKIGISRSAEKLARSELLPKVALQAGWTMDGPILTEVPPIDRNLSYWWIGLGVSYNLSSLYKSNKELSRRKAAIRVAEDQLAESRDNIAMAVRADYVRYLEAYEELKSRTKGVELAERNYKIVAMRYSEGMALITDMLDAANSRLDAEEQLLHSRISIIYNYYKLLFTSGKI